MPQPFKVCIYVYYLYIVVLPSIEFLDHRIDAKGLHKSDKYIEAIRDAPKPTTAELLQLFLEKAIYYNIFILNLSTLDRSLYTNQFIWTLTAEEA